MKILAVDTSTSVNTVAVCDDTVLLAETRVQAGRTHSERLVATVDWVLAQAGIELADLGLLAVSIGPGSFTGLRVGAAAWKGLAAATGLGLVAVPTLDAMARQTEAYEGLVCPVLDAKMKEVFGAVYRYEGGVREKLTGDRVCPIEDLIDGRKGRILFLGDGAERYRDRIVEAVPDAAFVSPAWSWPTASSVALEARALVEAGASTDPADVSPVYLRKSQAEEARDAKAAP
ncbi:MAG: tRNA (adenosine(37)-N6)-threonylcarbamoyltransferase complex dimerization subunit type 1 TsaB [bacterium]|nr:tRNA (adenosine(37)-N6)-threonylcarbamoyltransferase complex dimerization subunit type 1 TsaB [bacterium]